MAGATYRWGVDRSGAATQNLGVLSGELQQCQDVLAAVISARLSNVLCPAVDVVVGEVEIVRGATAGEEHGAKKRKTHADDVVDKDAPRHERRLHHYARPLVDPGDPFLSFGRLYIFVHDSDPLTLFFRRPS